MKFKSGLIPPTDMETSALWFLFKEGRLLTRMENGAFFIPETTEIADCGLSSVHRQYLGSVDERSCYAGEWPQDGPMAGNFEFRDLRVLFGRMEEDLVWVAGRANQLLYWDRSHRYCGRCGNPTRDKTDERAKTCPACGLVNYPRLSPAVIVAVLRDDRILLARNRRFKSSFYSVLAGFVEPGETLEECVQREIHEEVGIRVHRIRYFGSQPWPFPDSLMIGFVAEHKDGEIRVDDSEIVDAAWFTKDSLPEIPPRISIARQLIDWFVEARGKSKT